MSYGATYAQLRKEKGCTQADVAEYINRYSKKPYSIKMISHWENNVSSPPIEQFLLLCEYYKVMDIQGVFRGFTNDHGNYLRINSLGKSRIDEYISMINNNSLFTEYKDSKLINQYRYIPVYDIAVAAGAGNYLDNDSYEDLEVDETIPYNANFAVRINGDSMMPRFTDGQIIFIHKQQTISNGEIGIFELNGESFIKILRNNELISINPNYKPIKISKFDSFKIYGKVLG